MLGLSRRRQSCCGARRCADSRSVMKGRRELARFVETTSMKGVGRAYKSPITVLRVIWSISVIVFFSAAAYQCYTLLSDYLTFPTVTTIKQKYISDFVNADSIYEVPDITLCNLNAYASDRNLTNITSVPDFIARVNTIINESGDPETNMGIKMSELIMTTEGYYQYIGRQDAARLGHDINELIASCYMNVFDGFAVSIVNCNKMAEFVAVANPRLLQCFTIAANTSSRKFISGYSLVVHLDNNVYTPYNYLNSPYEFSKSLGLVVVPHMHGTKAWFERTAIHIHPGKHTDVKLHLEETLLQEPPYGTCENIANLIHNEEWKYSVQACVSDCLERQVVEECGCRDTSMMGIMEIYFKNYPYCLNLPDNATTLESGKINYDCARHVRLTGYPVCTERCPPPCAQLSYVWDLSESLWPPDPTSEIFFEKYIKGRHFESSYYPIEDTPEYKERIRNNFASVKIYISAFSVLEYKEHVKTQFFSFLSSMGAALNLWAGITVVVAVEFVEVCVRLCLRRDIKDRNPPEAAAQKQEPGEVETNNTVLTKDAKMNGISDLHTNTSMTSTKL